MVWSMDSKSFSRSKTIVDIAANLTVIDLTDAYNGTMPVMNLLGTTMAFYCYNFCSEADATVIAQSERCSTEEASEALEHGFHQERMRGISPHSSMEVIQKEGVEFNKLGLKIIKNKIFFLYFKHYISI